MPAVRPAARTTNPGLRLPCHEESAGKKVTTDGDTGALRSEELLTGRAEALGLRDWVSRRASSWQVYERKLWVFDGAENGESLPAIGLANLLDGIIDGGRGADDVEDK